jgi:hypothetical protein
MFHYHTTYTLPRDYSWVPVKIVNASLGVKNVRALSDHGDYVHIEEKELDYFHVEAIHADPFYVPRPQPYSLDILAFPARFPSRLHATSGRSFTNDFGLHLMRSTGTSNPEKVTADQLPGVAERMIGAIVMMQVRHVVRDNEVYDRLDGKPHPVPNRTIQVLTSWGWLKGEVPWRAVKTLMDDEVKTGSTIEVALGMGMGTVTACWMNGRWEHAAADLRTKNRK